jgi:HK97 family phage major capsid protein
MYQKGDRRSSYFRDLAKSQLFGDRDAQENLHRYAKVRAEKESRALGNTNTTGGSGGEFAPPEWLVGDFVALARPGRVTAGLYKNSTVPHGTSNVQLPKILTGTTVALQSTQNTALSQTDLTTGSVGTGFSTIGGKQVVSQQLLDQSEINFDEVITADLAGAWAQNFGTQILNGAGTGANNNSVVNGLTSATVQAAMQITFTSASPTAALLYSKCAGAISAFATSRYAEPTVWLMHPRRWYWLIAQVDSSGRPLVVPDVQLASTKLQSFNPIASNTGSPVAVAGAVGMFLGLPVVIDPLLPTNLGAGTNQDEIFLLKQDDLWLYESAPVAEVFNQPYADSMGVLFRLYSYVGTILNRQPYSIATINGTGLVAPTF